MARWTILLAVLFVAVLLALVSGCGEPTPATLTERALKELRSGRYDVAIATCTEAIRLDPRDAEAFLYRGRAFQFRNAMGDPKQAIADFSEAIRITPDSSDAYYSRALVHRDLGQTDLAIADERAARHVDGEWASLNRQLPDLSTPAVLAKARQDVAAEEPPPAEEPASGGDLPPSEDEQKALFERLKERFEPGFGTVRSEDKEADESDGNSLRHRPRRPVDQPTTSGEFPERSTQGSLFPSPPPLGQPGDGLPSGQNSVGNPGQPLNPTSPFQPRLPSDIGSNVNGPTAFGPRVRSPFPQRAPAPTGFRPQPTNPFGPPNSGTFAEPPSGVSGPPTRQFFNNPYSNNPYSNPAVRPPNPRDYIP